ncbi:Protein of unknown function [Escherichia coli D6-117.29]|nr:Protein of unknown function [Escherichia coli D6-117.29]
MKQWLAYLAKS